MLMPRGWFLGRAIGSQRVVPWSVRESLPAPEVDLVLRKVPCTQPLLLFSSPAWLLGNRLSLPAPCL